MTTENIKITWTDNETGEEYTIFNLDTTLADLMRLHEYVVAVYREATDHYKKNLDPEGVKINASHLNIIEDLERSAILMACAQCDWNKTKAAQQLGINRPTLQEIIKRRKISRTDHINKRLTPYYIESQISNVSEQLVRAEIAKVMQEVVKERLGEINGKVSDAVAGGDCMG